MDSKEARILAHMQRVNAEPGKPGNHNNKGWKYKCIHCGKQSQKPAGFKLTKTHSYGKHTVTECLDCLQQWYVAGCQRRWELYQEGIA